MSETSPKLSVTFEAGPMADIKKTGVGHYVDRLISSVASQHPDDIHLTGYYFDFLNRNNKSPQAPANVQFRKIQYIPGKVLSLCRRVGFQPPMELFIRQRADVTLFTNFVSLPTLRSTKTALVVYDLGFLDTPEYTQSVNLAFLQRFCPPSIKQADLIITISQFTKERLRHHFPDLKADVIVTPIPAPSGKVDRQPLSDQLLEKGVQPHKYLLYVGTIEPRKNLQNLVKAYTLLPSNTRNEYSLVLAGGKGWHDEAILADIADAQSQGLQVIQTGYVTHDEKNALYSNAACFVMPSHYEGFGMPILEAMQYNQPVACSDIAVFREVADNAALYFDKDDSQAIADSLSQLLTDEQLRQRLIAAAAVRLQAFNWETNASLVYDALVKLHR